MNRFAIFLLALGSALVVACEGPPGTDGVDGVAGADGSDGSDGGDGSDGSDGDDGADGDDGEDGQDWVTEPTDMTVTISGVETSGNPVVTFNVVDQDGEVFEGDLQGMLEDHAMRFTLAKLIPADDGSGDPNVWQSYINTTADTTDSEAGPDGVPVMEEATQATYEYSGTLEELGAGEWAYTYSFDIDAVTDPIEVSFDEDYLHRVAVQWEYELTSGEELISNPYFDWVPSGGDAPATRDMAAVDSCNECHNPLAIHGGGRIEIEYCVVCHNPGSVDPNSGNTVDLPVMVHKIHMGHNLPSVADNGGSYVIWGYRDGEHDYSHVGYPQDVNNCIKCHDAGDKETADADNWNTKPSMEACGACHDDVDYATGEGHDGDVIENNTECAVCHDSDDIIEAHVTEMSTPHNPELPEDVWEIEYELIDASVDSDNLLTVEFAIYADGAIQDWSEDPTGNGQDPGFEFAYAMEQDGIEAPADWNNLGMESAQPDGVDLLDIVDEGGTIACDSTSCIATIADAFPEGATMRTVAIQGYQQQSVDGVEDVYSLHTPSVYLTVTGDDERRTVVDKDSCANCHEYFEGHGGNRVYETQVCIMCHSANLATSGRTEDLENPVDSNNFKDMIHGIHSASVRDTPMTFYRSGDYGGYYAWITHDQLEDYPDGTVVAFPGEIGDCETCHLEDTYWPSEIPADALVSINECLLEGEETIELLESALVSVPNDTDLIYSPAVGACAGCHYNEAAIAHMEQNGGAFTWARSEYNAELPYESCTVCHGEDSIADIAVMHDL